MGKNWTCPHFFCCPSDDGIYISHFPVSKSLSLLSFPPRGPLVCAYHMDWSWVRLEGVIELFIKRLDVVIHKNWYLGSKANDRLETITVYNFLKGLGSHAILTGWRASRSEAAAKILRERTQQRNDRLRTLFGGWTTTTSKHVSWHDVIAFSWPDSTRATHTFPSVFLTTNIWNSSRHRLRVHSRPIIRSSDYSMNWQKGHERWSESSPSPLSTRVSFRNHKAARAI